MTSSRCLAFAVAAIVLASCAHDGRRSDSAAPPRPARINHVVFFKLTDSAETDALLADCDQLLAPIPVVRSYFSGRHIDTGRPSVESNYDAAVYLGFDSEQDYAAYVEHPSHVALVERWRPRLQWLRVYDVLDETP